MNVFYRSNLILCLQCDCTHRGHVSDVTSTLYSPRNTGVWRFTLPVYRWRSVTLAWQIWQCTCRVGLYLTARVITSSIFIIWCRFTFWLRAVDIGWRTTLSLYIYIYIRTHESNKISIDFSNSMQQQQQQKKKPDKDNAHWQHGY